MGDRGPDLNLQALGTLSVSPDLHVSVPLFFSQARRAGTMADDDVDSYFLPGGILDSPSKDDLDHPMAGKLDCHGSHGGWQHF